MANVKYVIRVFAHSDDKQVEKVEVFGYSAALRKEREICSKLDRREYYTEVREAGLPSNN